MRKRLEGDSKSWKNAVLGLFHTSVHLQEGWMEQFVQILIKTFAHLKTNVVQPIWLLQYNHDEQYCPSCFEILKTSVVQSILLLRLNQY